MAEPDYYTYLSLLLSQVLADIGLQEVCVNAMRTITTFHEQEHIAKLKLGLQPDLPSIKNIFHFGSTTECTTTDGLNSDLDVLLSFDVINVIDDYEDWVLGKRNALMLETETPGYCKLLALRNDQPLPEDNLMERCVYYAQGSVCVKNDILLNLVSGQINGIRNGPAITVMNDSGSIDWVPALSCKTWPKHYKRTISRRRPSNWPTPEMVREIETSGLFVVGTGHRLSDKPVEEWRISTSLAERCLMFHLNVTQIRCCVLLKMIVKTFIEPHVPDVISSYICKTLLFHCIERTDIDIWHDRNILHCMNRVLSFMLASVYSMNCPNYFNESVNLFLGKIDGVKRKKLLQVVRQVLKTRGTFLLQIHFDNINGLLTEEITYRSSVLPWSDIEEFKHVKIVLHLVSMIEVLHTLSAVASGNIVEAELKRLICATGNVARKCSIQSKVSAIVFPFLCSNLATRESNEYKLRGTDITTTTLLLFRRSLNSDVTSSRLKYASYLYSTGQFQESLNILDDVEQRLSDSVTAFYPCRYKHSFANNKTFAENERRICLSTLNVALCVGFNKTEMHCCPFELRFEVFKFAEEDMPYRDVDNDKWIDKAVVDSLPYIYFLKYMAHRRLVQHNPAVRALVHLICIALENASLCHRETVFNIVGQCMELNNKYDEALLWYKRSLRERPRNNAANWHIGRLLSSLVNKPPECLYVQI